MATDIKGFLKIKRQVSEYRPVCQRLEDYAPVAKLKSKQHCQEQGLRCMDCGTPFCHWACPVANYIPEWNELMSAGLWQRALELLLATNCLPEITGRVCPALCEYSCVLGINDEPVTVRENELGVIEYAFSSGLIKANPPLKRTGKKVAVIGSGPAGLSCADKLNRLGRKVVVFEKDNRIGGILRYGIPDFKLEKNILDRRIKIWQKEGIEFKASLNIGKDYPVKKLLKDFDAVCLAGGCRRPRDLDIEGRQLSGIHFAMDYLTQSNKRVAGEKIPQNGSIDAKNKRVLVIGGGDTGADCVGTAHRQGAACVVQIEVMPQPPECRTKEMCWPKYPLLLKTSTSHQEGGQRFWQIMVKKFLGQGNKVNKVLCKKLDFSQKDSCGCPTMQEVPGSDFEIEADLVILAIGFLHPEHSGLLADLKVKFDERGNVKTDAHFMTSRKKVFSAGDMRRGQSLVVWAIDEGARAAVYIDKYLTE